MLKKSFLAVIFCLSLAFITPASLRAQKIALKIDAAKAALWMPNLGAEFSVGDSYSFDVSVFGAYKVWSQNYKFLAIQPEFRWWMSGRQMARAYMGVSALGAHYNLDYSGFSHKGDLIGGGLTFGYAWFLSARWSMEAYAGFGAAYYKENRFRNAKVYEDFNPNKKEYGNASGYLLIPAKLGFSFSYILR